ncbi:vWA domain-containing protein [Corynebacterium resistens]
MARHANGRSSFQLAGWVWALLIALLVVTALVLGWKRVAENNQADVEAPTCAEGEYTLNAWVAPQREEAAQKLAEKYNSSDRVVRDKCTKVAFTTASDDEVRGKLKKPENVAAWLPADSQGARAAANKAGLQVGTGDSAKIGGGALLLFSGGNQLEEQASRTAQDLGKFALENGADRAQMNAAESDTGSTPASTSPGAAGDARGDKAGSDMKPRADSPRDVTFVLDTSGSMTLVEGSATRLDNIRKPLSDAMRKVGERGGAVGLWNYSSPLSDSARTPFRNNVDITNRDNGTIAISILNQLGAKGATHTYESIAAAYASAVAGAGMPGAQSPARVVLITDGPNDGGRVTLESAIERIRALHSKAPIRLDVVSIGANVDRPALTSLANAAGGELHSAPDSLQFERALKSTLR